MKAQPIEVRLAAKSPTFADGQLHVAYSVENLSRAPVYLVDLPFECCIERLVKPNACADPEATLIFCCAEMALEPNMGAYMFAEPDYTVLEPGASLDGEAMVELPLVKEEVDLQGGVTFVEQPLPETLMVAVRVGFLVEPFSVDEAETRPRDMFLEQQDLAQSESAKTHWTRD